MMLDPIDIGPVEALSTDEMIDPLAADITLDPLPRFVERPTTDAARQLLMKPAA